MSEKLSLNYVFLFYWELNISMSYLYSIDFSDVINISFLDENECKILFKKLNQVFRFLFT